MTVDIRPRVHTAGKPDVEDGTAVHLRPEDGNASAWR